MININKIYDYSLLINFLIIRGKMGCVQKKQKMDNFTENCKKKVNE